jgi:hypothetical protein
MDEQVELLRGIWNEMKSLNGRVSTTNERLDAVRTELKAEMATTRTDLKAEMTAMRTDLKAEMTAMRTEFVERIDVVNGRSVERDLRLGTSLAELSRDVRELTLVVHEWRDEHRLDRADLRARVERLERHAGV